MSTVETAQAGAEPKINIGLVFRQSWRLFVQDIGTLIVAALIAVALGVVTIGILAGPLVAGLYGMVGGRVRDGRRPQVGDVFNQMPRFWSFFGAALALGLLIGLAAITIIGGVLLATIWIYVFPLMVDRGMGLGQAMRESQNLVMRAGFWEHFALVIIFIVVASLANGALAVLATPFIIVAVAVAYFVATDRIKQVENA
jgi:hypothetical protein